ncbi:MAG: HAMP domain-containing sensor histidine kinase [Propionibacteriaceae bacterium]|nr:HAMP domain-containing sensor histidine kinase [Propionibacteriaceae bacterium]
MTSVLRQLLVLTLLATAGITATWLIVGRPTPAADTNALNDAVQIARGSWPELDTGALDRVDRPLAVVAPTGAVLYATSPGPPADPLAAAGSRALTAPVTVDGTIVALVQLSDDLTASDATARRGIGVAASLTIAATALGAAALLTFSHLRIVRPFRALQDFATRVAGGDLDAPLSMDRANVFGAWTESFDLLRSELAASHRREQAAQESKRTLVAQIGHDVRTPVASIAATAELMAAQNADPTTAARLEIITAKAAQIDALVTDLFRANRTELAALTVTPMDLPSVNLPDLIRAADYAGRARIGPFPAVILRADPHRLAQVFDNVVANAYKYAGTPLEVTADLIGASMSVRIADRGPGVPPAELPTIFARGVRASNVGDTPGQGLGLFTCAYLLEKMHGDIAAANTLDGFAVTIEIPLA